MVFTNGYDDYNHGVDPARFFISDFDDCYVTSNDAGEAVLKVRQHHWNYTVKDNVLRATCTVPGCSVDDQTLTLSVADKNYDGKAAVATITPSAGWTSDNELALVPDVSDVTYYRDGKALDGAPKDAGNYTAELVVPGTGQDPLCTSFRIRQAPLTVTAQDQTIAFGDGPANAGVTYAGFADGEDASVLSGTLTYDNAGYSVGSPAGTYAVTPSGLTAGNYAITYQAGTLTVKPDTSLPDNAPVTAIAHLQRKGTLPASTGVGTVIGTTGKSRRLESIRLSLSDQPLPGGIEYCVHVQRKGWQGWKADGAMAGTQGKARRIEAIRICLTG